MKMIKTTFALFIAFAMLFISCEEIEESNLTLDQTKLATVRAFIYAELDRTSNGVEFAPNGTKVYVSIENEYFNDDAEGNWIDTATVNNGMIELKVPATNDGVRVYFTPAEFAYDQVQPFGSVTPTINILYYPDDTYYINSVKPGEDRTVQIWYDSDFFDNYVETIEVKYEARATTDTTASIYAPAGTIINVYNDDFSTTATVGANGIFTANVPSYTTIYFRFEYMKILNYPAAPANYRYTENDYSDGPSPVTHILNFGGGSLWE